MKKMDRKIINWFGLTGLAALISYTAAVIISPRMYLVYNWMAQAVIDLSAESAPLRLFWSKISAVYDICSVVCATCVSVYAAERRLSLRLFRAAIHLLTVMNWVSGVGYKMFPLSDSGKEVASFQEIMHIFVTVMVVLLSIASLATLIIVGCRRAEVRSIGIWAATALGMMIGFIGTGAVPPQYFGIVERFSVFAAVGFNAVPGVALFKGFPSAESEELY